MPGKKRKQAPQAEACAFAPLPHVGARPVAEAEPEPEDPCYSRSAYRHATEQDPSTGQAYTRNIPGLYQDSQYTAANFVGVHLSKSGR